MSEREPQLVTLVGVPGIGKSRLVGAFFSHLESSPDLVWWRQGRAMPYGEGVSFWAIAEMVKAQAGIEENDSPDVAATKLRASVEHIVDHDKGWVVEHLLPLVGAEHRSGSGESSPAWRAYFEALAEQRPLVMVFEDMHWADDGLLDFIDHLVDWATGVPLLVIATARPELLERRPAWGGGKLNVSTVALTPLSDDEAAQIIHGVLEQAALPVETQQALLDRAGGNPLYAEQFARLYMERGTAEDLPMPETVQGLIAARLDGLSAEEKRIVQDASVFGKVFWAGALDADEQSLHSLERKGMLRRERRSAVGGETQYAFRHVLVRDVAYGQIPRAARAEKHVRAADWIEALGRADDHAELVAHHLGTALDLGVDVGDRARMAFQRAGERAQSLGAWPSADRYYAQAFALWPERADGYAELLAAHAWARARATGSVSLLEGAIGALETEGLQGEAATLAARAALAVWYQGNASGAGALIARAKALLAGRAPSPALAAVLAESARLSIFRGDVEDGEGEAAEAGELATRFGLDELRASVLVTQAVVKFMDGELGVARPMLEQAVELAPPGTPPLFRALANMATVDSSAGDAAAFRNSYAAALDAAHRAGDRPNVLWLRFQRVYYMYDFGEWDEILRLLDELVGDDPTYSDHAALLVKASIVGARGDLAQARQLRDAALAATSESKEDQTVIPTRLGAAWVSLLIGDEARMRQLVQEVWPIIEHTRYRAPGVGAREGFVVIRAGFREQSKGRHARNASTRRVLAMRLMLDDKVVEAAEAWALVSPADEATARLHAASVLAERGRHAEADVQLQRGLAFFRAVGAKRIIELAEAPLRAAAASE